MNIGFSFIVLTDSTDVTPPSCCWRGLTNPLRGQSTYGTAHYLADHPPAGPLILKTTHLEDHSPAGTLYLVNHPPRGPPPWRSTHPPKREMQPCDWSLS